MKEQVVYKKLLTSKDVMSILKCSPSMLESAVLKGKLKVYSKCQGLRLFEVNDVLTWVLTRKHGPTKTFMDTMTKEEFISRCHDHGIEICEF